jgi:hypothetical protein
LNEEQSRSIGAEEEKIEEPRREELETLGTALTVKVSTITPPIVLALLSNQSSQSYERTQRNVTNISVHTHSRNLGISMEDEIRLPIFRVYGSEDPNQHWFLCKIVWSIKQFNDEVVKRDQFSTTLRDRALSWYMKFVC